MRLAVLLRRVLRRRPRSPGRCRRASTRRRSGAGSATRRWSASRPTGACSSPPRAGIVYTSSTASTTRRRRVFADLRAQVQDFWDRGLLGLRSIRVPDGPPYVTSLYATTRHRARATPARAAGPPPHGCKIDGAALAPERDRPRDRADRGLLPAVPEPLGRARSTSAPTAMLYVSAGDGASFNYAGLRPDRATRAADPPNAGGATRRRRRPRAARCARRATAARPASPSRPDGAILRIDPAPRRQPAIATRPHRRGSSPTASATRSASRSGPGTGEIWIGRRRLEHVGGDQPRPGRHAASATTAGRATRAPAGSRAYDALEHRPPATTLYAEGSRDAAVLHLQPRRQGRRRRRLRPGRLVDLRPVLLHGHGVPGEVPRRRCSSATTRATASVVHAARGRRAARTPRTRQLFAGDAAGPGVPHRGPGRRALLRRPRPAARSAASADNSAPTARIAASPDAPGRR